MTMKNVPITFCLGFITASQFALGMWTVILNGKGGEVEPPYLKGRSRLEHSSAML